MHVSIMNRQQASEFTHQQHTDPYILISITDTNLPPNTFGDDPMLIGVLPLKFDDTEENEPNHITDEQAHAIVKFVKKFDQTISHIVVHCEGGVSRSAGIAAALCLHYNNDDWDIFNNVHLAPNMTCYKTLLHAFHHPIDDKIAQQKIDHNLHIWRIANDIDEPS